MLHPHIRTATIKCYAINSGNTTVYSNTGLTYRCGSIYGADEVTVLLVTSRYCKVRYPISAGRTKTGYIPTNAILTAVSGNSYPVSGGYKFAFVTTSNADAYITGSGSRSSQTPVIQAISQCMETSYSLEIMQAAM